MSLRRSLIQQQHHPILDQLLVRFEFATGTTVMANPMDIVSAIPKQEDLGVHACRDILSPRDLMTVGGPLS
jgi:hypothetical protein